MATMTATKTATSTLVMTAVISAAIGASAAAGFAAISRGNLVPSPVLTIPSLSSAYLPGYVQGYVPGYVPGYGLPGYVPGYGNFSKLSTPDFVLELKKVTRPSVADFFKKRSSRTESSSRR